MNEVVSPEINTLLEAKPENVTYHEDGTVAEINTVPINTIRQSIQAEIGRKFPLDGENKSWKLDDGSSIEVRSNPDYSSQTISQRFPDHSMLEITNYPDLIICQLLSKKGSVYMGFPLKDHPAFSYPMGARFADNRPISTLQASLPASEGDTLPNQPNYYKGIQWLAKTVLSLPTPPTTTS